MTPEEQDQIFHFGTVCYKNVICLIVVGVTYGPAMLGIIIAARLLNIKSWRQPKAVQLLCCMVIVLAETWNIFIGGFITLTEIAFSSRGGIQYPNPPSDDATMANIGEFMNVVIILVGDFVICWRAWVLLPYDKFWRSALVIIMIGNIGINITDAVFDTFAPNTLLSGSVIVLDWVATAVTMVVNMTATALIGWKAWTHHCIMKEASIWRRSRVQKTLLLFVESGALLLAIQLFTLIGQIVFSESGEMSSTSLTTVSMVSQVSIDIWTVSSALYPIAIIILIHSDNSPIVETFHLTHELPSVYDP